MSETAVPVRHIEVVAGVLRDHEGRYLLAERPSSSHYRGCWEFPGGKIEAGETHYEALQREMLEEVGVRVQSARALTVVEHGDERLRITLRLFLVTAFDDAVRSMEGQRLRWAHGDQIEASALTPADQIALPRVLAPEQLHWHELHAEPPLLAFEHICAQPNQTLAIADATEPVPGGDHDDMFRALLAHAGAGARRRLATTCVQRARRHGLHLQIDAGALPDRHALAQWRNEVSGARLGVSCADAGELERAIGLGCDYLVVPREMIAEAGLAPVSVPVLMAVEDLGSEQAPAGVHGLMGPLNCG